MADLTAGEYLDQMTKMMSKTLHKAGLSAMAMLLCLSPIAQAAAQTVNDTAAVPDIGLNVPQDARILADVPRNVYKPTAIVNGEIITTTDVDQRIAMLKMFNGQEIPPEQMASLRQEIFQNLVDEKLKIQEAKTSDMTVPESEVEAQFARIAQSMKITPKQLMDQLRDAGSSADSVRAQIRGEFAWERLLGRNVEPYANVSEDEVTSILDRLKASRGTEEYRVGEIYLRADAQNEQRVFENAQRVLKEIEQSGDFAQIAMRVSEATTKRVGGDLGWVKLSVLPEGMSEALTTMQPGQIAGPMPTAGGFQILFLIDKRKVLTADARDAKLSLKQISLDFKPGTSQAQATELTSNFINNVNRMAGCGAAEATAQSVGATVKTQDALPMRSLPPQVQAELAQMQVGQVTPPFGSPTDGVSVLVLCGREAPNEVALPKSEDIEERIRTEKIEKRSLRYLRDLRRDAIIEFS